MKGAKDRLKVFKLWIISLGWAPFHCLKVARQFTLIRKFCMIKAWSYKLLMIVFVYNYVIFKYSVFILLDLKQMATVYFRLAISVSHNALDSNKTKKELIENEAINICTSFKWAGFLCVLGLASVCPSSIQCYYKNTWSIFKYKVQTNVQSNYWASFIQSFQQWKNSFVVL